MNGAVATRSPKTPGTQAASAVRGTGVLCRSVAGGPLSALQAEAEASPVVQRLAGLQRMASAGPPGRPAPRPSGLAADAVLQRQPPEDTSVVEYRDDDGNDWTRDTDTGQWCTTDETGEKIFWDAGVYAKYTSIKSKPKAKLDMTYVQFLSAQLAKARKEELAKIPIDLSDEGALKSLYGSATVIDPVERVAAIKQLFEDAGFECGATVISTASSSDTPPHLFDVVDHPAISKFEIHPGGGIHKASYVRISTNKGMIKVINSNSDPAYDKLNEKKTTYITVSV